MANVGTDYNSSHPDSLLPPVKSTGYRLDTTQPGLFHVVTSYSPGQLLSQQIMRPPRLLTDIFNRTPRSGELGRSLSAWPASDNARSRHRD